MFKLLMSFFQVLKAGEQLSDVVFWKNIQSTAASITVILGFIVLALRIWWPDFSIPDDVLAEWALGIATVLGGFNKFLTVATTKKIGVK